LSFAPFRMPIENKPSQQFRFIRVGLPWILAAGIFAVYLVTLNHWVSFGNLEQVAKTAGYNWLPQFYGPVSFLATLPIRLLPAKWIPLTLNLFAAVCGAASMGLLARSVVLLPHDRTHEQRDKQRTTHWLGVMPTPWLAPVVAVLVCGLGLTFWEYATCARNQSLTRFGSGGVEMLDLLLIAYIIRCLLEFRVSQVERWLFKASFAYGAAMANNWTMFSFSPPFFSFFPLFLAALIWIRGLAFFNVRFLTRMLLWGLVGTTFYLLLPIVESITHPASPGFWSGLKVLLGTQRQLQSAILNKSVFFQIERPLWILSLYSLVPILAISIRWPSYFGDTSKLGQAIATFAFHLVHAAFLVVCLWIALDPLVAPRTYWPYFYPPYLSFLPLYYLSALSIGYFVAYFLLVFGAPTPSSTRKPEPVAVFINRFIVAAVWILCLLAPITLVYRNLPQIRISNGSAFKNFASLVSESLPKTNTVVLSDDRARLLLLEAYASRTGQSSNILFVDTASFESPEYHRFLHRKYGNRWPTNPGEDVKLGANRLTQMEILFYLNMSNALYYPHPSFGAYFELFDLEPHGMAYKMVQATTNSVARPPLSSDLLKENETFWKQADAEALKDLVSMGAAPEPGRPKTIREKIFKALHLSHEENGQIAVLERYYSRSRNYWGVQKQAAGSLVDAQKHFQRALELNPDNIVASVNLKCNDVLQKGEHPPVRDPQVVMDEFGRYSRWDELMNENGPYDEPTFTYAWGLQLADPGNGMIRQAIEQFQRVTALAPSFISSRLWLGHLYILKGHPDDALKVIEDIRARPDLLAATSLPELVQVEASALLEKTNLPAAEKIVNNALKQHPDDQELLSTAVLVYMNHAYYTNALPLLEQQLSTHPDDLVLLMQKGVANLQSDHFDEAIQALNRVMTLETNLSDTHITALRNRAIAYLRANRLEEAKKDYETLQRLYPTDRRMNYGLGEIAYKQRDTNAALRNYNLYLTNAENPFIMPPANSNEVRGVKAKVQELRPGYPTP
jgi:tetratricopeptide (TPR) repeat protein